MSTDALDLTLTAIRDAVDLPGELTPETRLLDLPEFSSIVIADVIERLEQLLGVALDDDLIGPDTFHTPMTVAALLVRPAMNEGTA